MPCTVNRGFWTRLSFVVVVVEISAILTSYSCDDNKNNNNNWTDLHIQQFMDGIREDDNVLKSQSGYCLRN